MHGYNMIFRKMYCLRVISDLEPDLSYDDLLSYVQTVYRKTFFYGKLLI